MSWSLFLRRSILSAIMPAALLLAAAAALPAAAPRVVRASPDNGDEDVPPGRKEIRIEFDQDMLAGAHSICGGGEEFPTLDGKPRWLDRRTS